ncbi:uncharacterized protein LOC110022991 [Phalaenopsis equestris]|uniref:uncharacterized protein LOC110022991 n=1 Tax=Phalaenopsis equestris TaxID=78828 RepID=UPI0009E5EEC9|nr:uncharacterized protein LOC110022991 [Phalaenopsis equestris]XP_020577830.1 uncharacterized protein LOC110022991 [Phalaenopsis equestris]XP_020577831.1 uncharacterized protein LOC110022991 [Phalaenopsis equestris]XP_020577832.1 uncharacterized protein LOC110022991 [Phalaenopsis equestris]
MAAELLRLESTRLYGSSNPGCIWGLFHIFDSYHRRENKRMLSYKRLAEGTDILMANETGVEDTVANKEEKAIVESKGNNMKKSSRKTRILNFIGRNLLKRQKHREKKPHSSSQLTRATSVHHIERNDLVTVAELSQITSDSETSTIALDFDDTGSLSMNEHESLVANELHVPVEGNHRALRALNSTGFDIHCKSHELDELGNHLLDEHKILKEKLLEARDALLKQKDSDAAGIKMEFSLLSKIFLDTLHLFNTNREALDNVCKGQNSFVSGIAAGIPIPSDKVMKFDSFINQSESADLQTRTFGVVPDSEVFSGSQELRKQGEIKTVLSRFVELKQRLKAVIVENKKEHHRISMDRILDKVPSGHKLLEDGEDNELYRRVGFFSRGGQRFKINRVAPGSSTGKLFHNRVQRSRSLTESLGRYSHLLDSISGDEVRKSPKRSNSNKEGSGLLHGKLPKTHRRLLSNPEFLSSYSFIKDVQNVMYNAFQSSKEPTLALQDSDFATTVAGSDKLNGYLSLQPAVEETAYEQEGSLESNVITNLPDKSVTSTVETSINETKGCEIIPGSINECRKVEQFQCSNILEEKNDSFKEQKFQVEEEHNVKPQRTSPISVLDPDIEEPVSPLKFTVMAGSDSEQLHENLEEQLPCPEAQKVAGFNELDVDEETATTNSDQAKSFLAHANEKDTATFNYVKQILSKSGYEALFCETQDFSTEVEATNHLLCGILLRSSSYLI